MPWSTGCAGGYRFLAGGESGRSSASHSLRDAHKCRPPPPPPRGELLYGPVEEAQRRRTGPTGGQAPFQAAAATSPWMVSTKGLGKGMSTPCQRRCRAHLR